MTRAGTGMLTAREAARRLGVKAATLYSYVHRGWLSSLPGPDGRSRVYLADEVEALRARAEASRGHRAVAETAMRWGQPIIDTAISSVGPDGPRYRGVPLAALLPRGFSRVAEHLIDLPPAPWLPAAHLSTIGAAMATGGAGGLEDIHRRLIVLLATCAPEDPRAILQLLAVACAVTPAAAQAAAACSHPADILAAALGHPEDAAAIDTALTVCAEHELNASTFAARVAASTGASLPMSLCAGLAALSGPRHGALSEPAEVLLADGIGRAEALLRAGQVLPGCGHRLYPDGDPRARVLLALAPLDPAMAGLLAMLAAQGHPPPNLDLGLVGLRRALGLPRGSAMAIFAVGRAAGWIAHVREEHARGVLIRPRARYVGGAVQGRGKGG